jgi:putative phosphoribosyl transferase
MSKPHANPERGIPASRIGLLPKAENPSLGFRGAGEIAARLPHVVADRAWQELCSALVQARPPHEESAMMFEDRQDAGRKLAGRLQGYRNERPVVLALPRGGVPVGYEVARLLDAPLDIVVVRKLGAPGQPELGIGALVDGDHPESVLDRTAIAILGVDRQYLVAETKRQLEEIRRRQAAYRSGRPPLGIADHTAIVVDDGLATGSTMRAALRAVRRAAPKRVVLAVPVAAAETLQSLAAEVDDVFCLSTPRDFGAVGQFYRDFRQTSDAEVVRLLDAARHAAAEARAAATV